MAGAFLSSASAGRSARFQAAWKHRDALFVPRYGTLGFVALPSIWIFQVLLSSLSPFAELCMILALFAGNWENGSGLLLCLLRRRARPRVFWPIALEGVPAWDLAWLFFQRIYYRQLMLYILMRSLLFGRSREAGRLG